MPQLVFLASFDMYFDQALNQFITSTWKTDVYKEEEIFHLID